ncbi:helix-turn-helix domain-containing protein [Ornithinibacillus sp. 179-J 7C1 HS]|uniref:helix-turn-helix domain-containing protein n=1 Tax=Ornithinibacillus sp. 179-J 7C1 HS TaxID=3142384 RepID=UPI0039A0A5D8
MKYYLNFEGTIGEFIKQRRKAKKINSVELSKELGKGGAYISQIENGHNKKPDFDMLYEIFKRIGIEEERIEDYLESFGFISPEREEVRIQEAIDRQENSKEYYEEYEARQKAYADDYIEYRKHEEEFNKRSENSTNNGDHVLRDIFNADIKGIHSSLSQIAFENGTSGFEFTRNLERTLGKMNKSENLYKFLQLMFKNDLDILDEDGMVRVINTLYEELNKQLEGWGDRPWGEPTIKQPINKL